MSKTGLKIATLAGEKIGELTRTKETGLVNNNSVVYSIPCKGCTKQYIGETGRGLKTRITEHRRDVLKHNTSNSLVLHIEKCKHLPKWEEAKEIKVGLKKRMRKAIEAALITTREEELNTKQLTIK